MQGHVTRAGEGQELLAGPVGAVLLTATPGLVLLHHPLAPRALGSPVHTHQAEDEWSYVLSGQVGFHVGDTEYVAEAGDLVSKPRGIPHAFWNPADEPALLLEAIAPGGFEGYFAELGAILGAGGPPDLAAVGALAARFGLDFDLDSVRRLVEKHGLRLA